MAAQRGRLDVVATPIGNLADLTPRAREALAGADLVAAEDTRRTALLLGSLGLSRPLVSLHEHNEGERLEPLLQAMQSGQVVALVSDAGTPLLSDPGFALVRAAVAAGIAVRPIPGVSAITAALSIAGLPTDRFAFEGFLPARAAERRRALALLVGEVRTLVWFEAPHRIAQTLADLLAVFGPQRRAVLTRELTKTYESVYRGTLAELAAQARTDGNLVRGELTLIVEGAAGTAHGDARLLAQALPLLLRDLPPARAAAIAAQLSGVPRAEAYRQALALGNGRR